MKKNIYPRCRLIVVLIILFSLVNMTNSCSEKNSEMGVNKITINGKAYSPEIFTITANATITWTNKDTVPHTVTSITGLFDSGPINSNETYSHVFPTIGSFIYRDSITHLMTGTIIVN
jgi:plastocyanin